MPPGFRLVYCPKCRELLTEFADIPLYRCGRCDAILQAKRFGSVVANGRACTSPVTPEDGPSQIARANGSEDDAISHDDKSLSYQCVRDASDLESHSMKVSTTTNVPAVIGGEQLCIGNTFKHQGSMNENPSSSNLEISDSTDGFEVSLGTDSPNTKKDVVDGDPAIKFSDDKTRDVSSHRGSESSSGSPRSKYEKGEIVFMDRITTYSSKSLDGMNLVTGTSPERKASTTSEELYSVQDWLESESVTSFESLSRTSDAGISENDRRKILRKINELRNHLIRTHIQSRGLDDEDHVRAVDHAGGRHRFESVGSSHSCKSLLPISQHSFHMVEAENSAGPIQSTSTLLHPTQSHCLSNNYNQASGPSKYYPSSSGIYKNCCRMCSHPVKSEGPQHFARLYPSRCYHNEQRHTPHDHEVHNWNSKMEELSVKRHCRPILGGSSFISCYKCLQVLEIPEDFQFLMRIHAKLRCGFCLEVLKFSIYKKTKIVPYCFAVEQIPAELEDDSNATLQVQGAPSPNHYSCQSWGVPYSNEYDPSPSRIFSMEGENTPYRGTCEIQVPLHSLMGYISASEILYQDQE